MKLKSHSNKWGDINAELAFLREENEHLSKLCKLLHENRIVEFKEAVINKAGCNISFAYQFSTELANGFREMLKEHGASNYVSLIMQNDLGDKFEVIVQKAGRLTPAQVAGKRKEFIEEFVKQEQAFLNRKATLRTLTEGDAGCQSCINRLARKARSLESEISS